MASLVVSSIPQTKAQSALGKTNKATGMLGATGEGEAKAKTVSELMTDAQISLATLRLAVEDLKFGCSQGDPLSRSSVMGPALATALTFKKQNLRDMSGKVDHFTAA